MADEFRTSLGDLCGRYWPETWFHDNPSLIGNGTYGFHPFQTGDDIGSFPSGHAARIFGFATTWWIAIPRGRVLLVLICVPMLVSLVAMNELPLRQRRNRRQCAGRDCRRLFGPLGNACR